MLDHNDRPPKFCMWLFDSRQKKNASEIAPANVQWQVALDIAYNSGFIIITNLRWTVNQLRIDLGPDIADISTLQRKTHLEHLHSTSICHTYCWLNAKTRVLTLSAAAKRSATIFSKFGAFPVYIKFNISFITSSSTSWISTRFWEIKSNII